MNGKDFIKFLDKHLDINCPKYRGASMPAESKSAINESNFADELRFKSTNWKIDDDLTLSIDWISQAWTDDNDSFFKEIIRCIEYHANKKELTEDVYINIYLKDRDNTDSKFKSFTINAR